MMCISLTLSRVTYIQYRHMHSVLQITNWHGLVRVKWFKHVSLNSMYTSCIHSQYITSLLKYVNTRIYTCFFWETLSPIEPYLKNSREVVIFFSLHMLMNLIWSLSPSSGLVYAFFRISSCSWQIYFTNFQARYFFI